MPTTRKQVEELIARLEPTLRKAFQDALDDWRNNIDMDALAAAIQRGNLEEAIRVAGLQPGVLTGFLRSYELAFEAAGVAEMTGLRLNIIFNVRHLSGERMLRDYAARLVQGIDDNSRAMLRTVLTDGLARGQGSRATARELLSYIGMTDYSAKIALNFRRKLETDPKSLLAELSSEPKKGNYLLRDRRLDGIIRRAVRDGKPIAAADIDKIITAYTNRSIRERAISIARTETLKAVNAGQHASYVQAVESGKVAAQDIRKTWWATRDNRVRDTHKELDRESVGLNEYFVSSSGARLLHPGDESAPASEVCNCRCVAVYRIDHLSNLGKRDGNNDG